MTVPLSLPMCLTTHTILFFLLINTLVVSLLSVFVVILSPQSQRARALSLTTGLVARIWCSHRRGLNSISGREPKPCFRPLQDEVTRDHWEHRRKTQCLPLRRSQSLLGQSGYLQYEQSRQDRSCGITELELPTQPGKVRKCFPRWQP